MKADPTWVARRPTRRTVTRSVILFVVFVVGVSFAVKEVFFTGGLPTSVPSCSWPVRIQGPATGEQAGLIRCYIRALATRNLNGMKDVADNDPPVRITNADMKHAGDAQAGVATATLVPNQVDSAFFYVDITFADHARESLGMYEVNPVTVHSWRFEGIGTDVNPGGPSPPTAQPG